MFAAADDDDDANAANAADAAEACIVQAPLSPFGVVDGVGDRSPTFTDANTTPTIWLLGVSAQHLPAT